MIKQTAPYPLALRSLISRLRYKAGWFFELLDDFDRGQDSQGMTLVISINVPNSYDESQGFVVNHYMIVPAASYNEASWRRWLFDQIVLVETHEAMEFFKIDGSRPYAPNHTPGNEPYVVRETCSLEDAKRDEHGIPRDVEV